MASATNANIVQAALYSLGEEYSTSSPVYSVANYRLPEIRDALLYDLRWEFAVKMLELSEVATPTGVPSDDTHRYANIFTIPTTVIRVLGLTNKDAPAENRGIDTSQQFVVAGDQLFTTGRHEGSDTSDGKLWVWVIDRVTDPSDWDPLFKELVVVDLVLASGFYASTNPVALQYFARLRDTLYNSALAITARENSPQALASRSGFLMHTEPGALQTAVGGPRNRVGRQG